MNKSKRFLCAFISRLNTIRYNDLFNETYDADIHLIDMASDYEYTDEVIDKFLQLCNDEYMALFESAVDSMGTEFTRVELFYRDDLFVKTAQFAASLHIDAQYRAVSTSAVSLKFHETNTLFRNAIYQRFVPYTFDDDTQNMPFKDLNKFVLMFISHIPRMKRVDMYSDKYSDRPNVNIPDDTLTRHMSNYFSPTLIGTIYCAFDRLQAIKTSKKHTSLYDLMMKETRAFAQFCVVVVMNGAYYEQIPITNKAMNNYYDDLKKIMLLF